MDSVFYALHAVNLLLSSKILSVTLFKIITVSRLSTLLRALLRRSGCPTNGRNWGGGSPCKPKSLNFSLLLDITPHPFPDHRPNIEKKDISNSFYSKFCLWHAFSVTKS